MKNRLKGVTLIETMLYIGLFSIIMVIILNFMLSTQEATNRNNEKTNLNRTSVFLSQHISDSFSKTISINQDTSVFDSDQGVLTLNFSSEGKQYTFIDSRIYFNNIPITPTSLSITQFKLEPVFKDLTALIGVKITISAYSEKVPELSETINILEIIR